MTAPQPPHSTWHAPAHTTWGYPTYQAPVVYAPKPRYVGLSTGAHLVWLTATVCSAGLLGPFWFLHWWLSRKRIS